MTLDRHCLVHSGPAFTAFLRARRRSDGIYASLKWRLGRGTPPPMSRKIAAGWPSGMALRPAFAQRCIRPIRPMSWWASGPWQGASRPRLATPSSRGGRSEGLAIAATAAIGGPILLVDPTPRLIGAAHAGWKGALTGILESTVDAMESSAEP